MSNNFEEIENTDEQSQEDLIEEVESQTEKSIIGFKGKISKKLNVAKKKIIRFFVAVGIIVVLGGCLYIGFNFAVGIRVARILEANALSEKIEITNVHIERKLEAIGEFATYSFEYRNEKRITDSREIFSKPIPGTKNQVDIIYSGIIKVGCNVSDISFEVDNTHYIIYVSIPEMEVLDNYIKLDDLQCKEKNNILNPIGSDEITMYFEEIQKEELALAEKDGIYSKAEEQLKKLIQELLAAFEDYVIVFVDSN